MVDQEILVCPHCGTKVKLTSDVDDSCGKMNYDLVEVKKKEKKQ